MFPNKTDKSNLIPTRKLKKQKGTWHPLEIIVISNKNEIISFKRSLLPQDLGMVLVVTAR